MLDAITCLTFALVLAPLGAWGRRHAHELAPGSYPEEEREHRERVLRRGALTAQAVAVMFFISGVLLMFD